jgi:hypothetical protein
MGTLSFSMYAFSPFVPSVSCLCIWIKSFTGLLCFYVQLVFYMETSYPCSIKPIVFCLGLTAIFHLISSDPMVVMGQSIFPSRGLKSSPSSNYMKSVKTVCFSIRFLFFPPFFNQIWKSGWGLNVVEKLKIDMDCFFYVGLGFNIDQCSSYCNLFWHESY